MKLTKEIRFTLSILACALFLMLFHFDDQRTALLRLDESLHQDSAIPRIISAKCTTLSTARNAPTERYLVQKLLPTTPTTAQNNGPHCTMAVESSSTQRFYLRSTWVFAVRVISDRDGLLAQRAIPVGFPRPLCLLPFAILLLALLMDIKLPKFAYLTLSYVFLLGGFNLIQTVNLITSSLAVVLSTESSLPGYALILIWLALVKHSNQENHPRSLTGKLETLGNRTLSLLIGMWNPGVFTSLGSVLFPFRGHIARLKTFFDAQLVVAAASLYLFSFEFANPISTIQKSLSLPRYFSFSLIALFAIQFQRSRRGTAQPLWRIPHFGRCVGFIVAMELIAFKVPQLRHLTTVTRVGLALILSELVGIPRIRFTPFAKTSGIWLSALLLAFWLPALAASTGLCELALGLSDPRLHPSSFVLFTFLGATITSFVTGSFSLTFFTFFSLLVGTNREPAVRAAFLDGVLAGSFLSPLSLHNLIPSVQFDIPMRNLLAMRFKQLSYPLLMAAMIYAVTIPAVMILRPLVFTFLCLVVLTLELRRNHWVFSSASAVR